MCSTFFVWQFSSQRWQIPRRLRATRAVQREAILPQPSPFRNNSSQSPWQPVVTAPLCRSRHNTDRGGGGGQSRPDRVTPLVTAADSPTFLALLQAAAEANQEERQHADRARLPAVGAAPDPGPGAGDRHDEPVLQLPAHVTGKRWNW